MRSSIQTRYNTFLRFFPLPKFVDLPAVGLDISDLSIKYIELLRTHRGIRIGRFGEKRLDKGIVESGEIAGRDELVRALANLKKEQNLSHIRASLPEEKGFLFESEVPRGIRQKEARSALEFRLEENVPISLNEAVFDYEVIGDKKRRSQSNIDVVVTVFPRPEVERYLDIFYAAGLVPLSLEIEAQAIARAVVRADDLGTYLIVDFGKNRSGISIVSGGAIRFTTTVDAGGEIITETLRRQYPEASDTELDDIKNEKGIKRGREGEEVITALMSSIEMLRDEINKHFIYWHTHAPEGKKQKPNIEKILLCGGNANIAGLPEYLARSLKIPTERANVWVNAFDVEEYIPPISFRDSLTYAPAIGLALHGDTERFIPI